MRPSDLIAAAEKLVPSGPGRPLEADLRRAVSTAYYALFHGLAECCADELFNRNMRGHPGWIRIYRAVNHGQAEQACRRREVLSLPGGIQYFARSFVDLQEKRHLADYDPVETFNKSEVVRLIVDTRVALRQFESADRLARKSFAVLVLFRRRN